MFVPKSLNRSEQKKAWFSCPWKTNGGGWHPAVRSRVDEDSQRVMVSPCWKVMWGAFPQEQTPEKREQKPSTLQTRLGLKLRLLSAAQSQVDAGCVLNTRRRTHGRLKPTSLCFWRCRSCESRSLGVNEKNTREVQTKSGGSVWAAAWSRTRK